MWPWRLTEWLTVHESLNVKVSFDHQERVAWKSRHQVQVRLDVDGECAVSTLEPWLAG
jgi:hypothetical protein